MPKSPAERVKTARIRRKVVDGVPLTDDDAAHLEEYEETAVSPQAKNRSASSRTVHLDIEEQAAAEGNHPHPEMYAAAMRSEGLRADTLLRIVTDKLIACNDQYMKLMIHMMERSTRLEDAHVGLLEAVRSQVLSRIDAEAEARALASQLAAGGGEEGGLGELLQLLQLVQKAKDDQKGKPKSREKKKPLGVVD